MLLKQGEKIAFGGVLAALCTVLVSATGLFPTLTYAIPALAGVLLVAAVIEIGKKEAFACYAVTAVLSLLLGTDKEAALLFVLLFGYYPTLKSLLDPIRSRPVQWGLKLLVANAAMVLFYVLTVYVLGVPQESLSLLGVPLPLVILVLGNLVFLLYDRAISGIAVLYVQRIHPVVLRIFRK
ncbi:MAG TPA: hypothetical protein IAB66_01255 [Candidatus Caccousia avistercoris]|nr:hypothetical protein [Candidatus Caccousia avistercoris]